MQAGRLRARVTIERSTRTRDPFGAPIDMWAPIATIWADVRAVPAEQIRPGLEQPIAIRRWNVRTRAPVDCTPLDRLILPAGEIAGIEGISDPGGRGAMAQIAAYELVDLREGP